MQNKVLIWSRKIRQIVGIAVYCDAESSCWLPAGRERRGRYRAQGIFYAVIIMPVKAKHFPTYGLVSATLWNEQINVLIHRQKGLLLKVLLANSWVFRLSLIETLKGFLHISIASNNVCLCFGFVWWGWQSPLQN